MPEELSETQARIYIYLLAEGGKCGVREIARDLGLSPSTVHYNLRKLEEMGYVARTPEGYVIKKKADIGGLLIVGGRPVPRLLVYAMFFAGVSAGTLISLALGPAPLERYLLLASSSLASALFFAEAWAARRKWGARRQRT